MPPDALSLPSERLVQHRRQQRVELRRGLGLQPLERVDADLQVVQAGDDAVLFQKRRDGQLQGSDIAQIQTWLALTITLSQELSLPLRGAETPECECREHFS